ncbi:MAG: glycosyltransferase family 2 protein [Capnocytophaga sp.]|nr:glycosyltransferase family 2 protein [Capnocytophaga sp.]
MKVTLLISTYNWAPALGLCLKSIGRQTVLPDEIIIADDGSTPDTKALIDQYRTMVSIPLKHVWHEDKGFRKTIILNKAVSLADMPYVIQIDGDVILHRKFVEDHISFARKGYFNIGRRANLPMEITQKLISGGSLDFSCLDPKIQKMELGIRFPTVLSALLSQKSSQNSNSVFGSNMSYWKADFVKINGYDNTMTGWGAEDKDLAQRLINLGISKRKLRYAAIQHHLFHKENNQDNHDLQMQWVQKVIAEKITECPDGLKQLGGAFLYYS